MAIIPIVSAAISELASNVLIPAGVLGIAGCLFAVLLLFAFLFPIVVDCMTHYEKGCEKLLGVSVSAIREHYESFIDNDEWDRKRIIAGGVSAFFALGFFCAAVLSLICSNGHAWGNVYGPLVGRFMLAAAICLGSTIIFSAWLFIDYRLNYNHSMSVTRLIHKALVEDIQDDKQMSVCMKLLCTFLDYEVSEKALDDIYTIVWEQPDSEGGRMCIAVILNDFGPAPDTSGLSETAVSALTLLKNKYERYLPKGENV